MQKILNKIRTDSAKFAQIDQQRSAVFSSINQPERKESALAEEGTDVKNDLEVNLLKNTHRIFD
jgi:hypothetical protein